MNIFWLHPSPKTNAAWYNDQHCVKIILEITQVLFTALHTHNEPDWQSKLSQIYRPTHKGHPITLWVTEHPENFKKALLFAKILCTEFTKRRNKYHKCERLLHEMLEVVPTTPMAVEWKPTTVRAQAFRNCTPVPLCMDVSYHVTYQGKPHLFDSYIRYYTDKKLKFESGRLATWSHGVPRIFQSAYSQLL